MVFADTEGTYRLIIKDTSLPENTSVTVGGNASFDCVFAYHKDTVHVSKVSAVFKFTKTMKSGNGSYLETCWSQHNIIYTDIPIINGTCSFRNLFQINRQEFVETLGSVVNFTVLIPNVSKELDGSTVSCSVRDLDNHLQWERVASLTVIDLIKSPQTSGNQSILPATIVVLVLVLATVVVAVIISIVVWKSWTKRRNLRSTINPDESKNPIKLRYNNDFRYQL